jgi:hypothetical protein
MKRDRLNPLKQFDFQREFVGSAGIHTTGEALEESKRALDRMAEGEAVEDSKMEAPSEEQVSLRRKMSPSARRPCFESSMIIN